MTYKDLFDKYYSNRSEHAILVKDNIKVDNYETVIKLFESFYGIYEEMTKKNMELLDKGFRNLDHTDLLNFIIGFNIKIIKKKENVLYLKLNHNMPLYNVIDFFKKSNITKFLNEDDYIIFSGVTSLPYEKQYFVFIKNLSFIIDFNNIEETKKVIKQIIQTKNEELIKEIKQIYIKEIKEIENINQKYIHILENTKKMFE